MAEAPTVSVTELGEKQAGLNMFILGAALGLISKEDVQNGSLGYTSEIGEKIMTKLADGSVNVSIADLTKAAQAVDPRITQEMVSTAYDQALMSKIKMDEAIGVQFDEPPVVVHPDKKPDGAPVVGGGANPSTTSTPTTPQTTQTPETQPSASTVSNVDAIKSAETLLSSFGIDVGVVDGKVDAKFTEAVDKLKTLMASVAGVTVSTTPGLNGDDINALEKGIRAFVSSPQFKDLQQARQGTIPESAGLKGYQSAMLEASLGPMGEGARIRMVLGLKAASDPEFGQKLSQVDDKILGNIPAIMDGLQSHSDELIAGLRAAYVPSGAGASQQVAQDGQNKTAPSGSDFSVGSKLGISSAHAEEVHPGEKPQGSEKTPVTTDTGKTDNHRSSATTSSGADDEKQLAKDVKAIESLLFENQKALLGKISGPLDTFGINPGEFLPLLTKDDLNDGATEFGVKSQQMTAMVIMALKKMDGEKNPNGTYDASIGKQLQKDILTKDEFAYIRENVFHINKKFSAAEAGALLSKGTSDTREILEMRLFFDALDRLEKKKKLDRDNVATSTTPTNLLLDGLCQFLDKSSMGQQFKGWIRGFFTNSQIGQMVGSVLAMFGINVGRLWGDKDDAGAMDRAKPTVENIFAGYTKDAQNDLGPNASFADVMAKTKEEIMKDVDSGACNAAMKLIFGDADKETIKKALETALDNAAKQPNADAAKQVFADSLVEMGKQYQNGKQIDLDQVAKVWVEAKETVEQAEARQKQGLDANPFAPVTTSSSAPTTSPSPAGAASGGLSPDANSGAEQSAGGAKPDPVEVNVNDLSADMAGNVIKEGDQSFAFVYKPDPKNYEQSLQPSNGRVQDMLEVITQGVKGGKIEMSLGADLLLDDHGALEDRATKPVCAYMEELVVRAQIWDKLEKDPAAKIDLNTLDRKLSAENLSVVLSYLEHNNVEGTDKFQKAALSMAQDHTLEGAFVNGPQLDLVKVVGDLVKQHDAGAPKAGNDDQRFLQMYREKNAHYSGDNCAPLIFMARRDENGTLVTLEDDKAAGKKITLDKNGNPEGYGVYAGVMLNGNNASKTDDEFKVYEVKDFRERQSIQPSDEGGVYKALRDNYKWSDEYVNGAGSGPRKSQDEIAHLYDKGLTAIDVYIANALCLKAPVVKLDAPAQAPAKQHHHTAPASSGSVASAKEETDRPFPRNYNDLLKEPFLVSNNEVSALAGGKLDLNKMYKQVEFAQKQSSTTWARMPQFKDGPYMITRLGKDDAAKLGGDVVISRNVGGILYHSVINTKKDMIAVPGVGSGSGYYEHTPDASDLAARRTAGQHVLIGLDHLLDRNINGGDRSSDGMGTPYTEMVAVYHNEKAGMYTFQYADNEFFGGGSRHGMSGSERRDYADWQRRVGTQIAAGGDRMTHGQHVAQNGNGGATYEFQRHANGERDNKQAIEQNTQDTGCRQLIDPKTGLIRHNPLIVDVFTRPVDLFKNVILREKPNICPPPSSGAGGG